MTWRDYPECHPTHTVVGTLKLYEAVHSPQLGNRRDLLVWLPPNYDAETRRYPVMYLHDGQNLFDSYTSYAGEWRVDETMERLSQVGYPGIVVGLPNMGIDRVNEYSPWAEPRQGGGRGDAYLAFVVETVKPLVDDAFRTLAGRDHTGIMGSSMGGLISLYGFFRYSSVFSVAGVMSPALWFADRSIFGYIERAAYQPGAIYLDIGGREGVAPSQGARRRRQPTLMVRNAREMRRLLRSKGYQHNDLLYVEDPDAAHCEAAWAERLPVALRFLLERLSRNSVHNP